MSRGYTGAMAWGPMACAKDMAVVIDITLNFHHRFQFCHGVLAGLEEVASTKGRVQLPKGHGDWKRAEGRGPNRGWQTT